MFNQRLGQLSALQSLTQPLGRWTDWLSMEIRTVFLQRTTGDYKLITRATIGGPILGTSGPDISSHRARPFSYCTVEDKKCWKLEGQQVRQYPLWMTRTNVSSINTNEEFTSADKCVDLFKSTSTKKINKSVFCPGLQLEASNTTALFR